jgi:hypothetical protein
MGIQIERNGRACKRWVENIYRTTYGNYLRLDILPGRPALSSSTFTTVGIFHPFALVSHTLYGRCRTLLVLYHSVTVLRFRPTPIVHKNDEEEW